MPTPLEFQRIYNRLSEKYTVEDSSIEAVVPVIRETASAKGVDLNSILDKFSSPDYSATVYQGVSVKNILALVWAAALDSIDHEGNETQDPDVIASKKGAVIEALAESQNTYGPNVHSSTAGIAGRLLNALVFMHPLVHFTPDDPVEGIEPPAGL